MHLRLCFSGKKSFYFLFFEKGVTSVTSVTNPYAVTIVAVTLLLQCDTLTTDKDAFWYFEK